jgi:hypothetical protein
MAWPENTGLATATKIAAGFSNFHWQNAFLSK